MKVFISFKDTDKQEIYAIVEMNEKDYVHSLGVEFNRILKNEK